MIYKIPFTLVITGEYSTTDEPNTIFEAIREARNEIPPSDNEGVDSNYKMVIHAGEAYEWDGAAQEAHKKHIERILKS